MRSTARTSAIIAIVAILGLLEAGRAHAARYALWASDEFDKVSPQSSGTFAAQTYVWSTTATDSTITLYGARNEYVACQLVIDANQDDLYGVDVSAGALAMGTHSIPADSIRLYYEHTMFIHSQHPDQPGKASLAAALYRDALIPFRDPYSPGATRVAGPFWVQNHTNRVVWVDIHIPADAPAGLYAGDLTVIENTSTPRHVRVTVNVWNFTIPERTQLVAWAGLHPEYFLPGEEVDSSYSGLNADAWSVLREYELMAHEHRFTIAHKNMTPWATFNPDGSLASVDWSRYDQYLGRVIDGSVFPDHQAPAVWMLPYARNFRVPFRTTADARAVREWTAEVVAHFQSKGWPLTNAFAWVYDEPRIDTTITFPDELIGYAAALRAGSPLVRIMMTDAIEDSVLLGSGDWWCSKADKYYPPEMDGLETSGRLSRKMFYQSYAEPSLPVESIDVNGLAWRVWPWVGMRYGVDGILYWAANYWNPDAPYDSADGQPESYNDGEGTFFYPGARLPTQGYPKIRGPVSSFRMKAFRRGLEDCAYLERMRAKGQSSRADSLVNAMVSSALCATHASSPIYRGGISRYIGPFMDPRWIGDSTPGVSEWKQTGNDWWQARLFMGNILSGIGEDTLCVWVLSPNGGEAWSSGTLHTITWETSGPAVSSVDLFVSQNGGLTWSDTLAMGEPNDGSYSWRVSGTVGDSIWVAVRAHRTGGTALDLGDGPLRIGDGSAPYCHLTRPNGGEIWGPALPETIRWTATDNGTVTGVDLDLSSDGGATWPVPIASMTPNDGIFIWTVPGATPDTRYAKVRARAYDASGLSGLDLSDAVFSILHDTTPPIAQLVAPNGGELWTRQMPETIRWVAGNNDSVAGIDLRLSEDGGATWPVTIAIGLEDTGTHVWTVPDTLPRTTAARVKVTARDAAGFSASDASDANFSVQGFSVHLTSPNGGEQWDLGTVQAITWITDGAGPSAIASVYLSDDGGATCSDTLAVNIANDGRFDWTVTGARGSNRTAVVRVCDGGTCHADPGDGTFRAVDTLPPVVTVLEPNGGDIWNQASPETIRWLATDGDMIDYIMIILSHSGGSGGSYVDTIGRYLPNTGVAVWSVGMSAPIESDTRIRVLARDDNGHNGYDNGDANFSTQAPLPDLVVATRMMQDPASPGVFQVYAQTSKEISDTSLTATVNGAAVVMAPSDTTENLWHGTRSITGGGTVSVTACARDWGGYRDCETRNVAVTRLTRTTGGTATSPASEVSLTVPPLALAQDTYLVLGAESAAAAGSPEAWSGALVSAVYEIGPSQMSLSLPATVRITSGIVPGRTALARELPSDLGWTPVSSWIDGASGALVATITTLGRYAVITSTTTSVDGAAEVLPARTTLETSRPNPFRETTLIRYVLPRASEVRLEVFDIEGRRVRTLADDLEGPGRHEVRWNGRDERGDAVPSGVYVYRLEAAGRTETRKMILLR